jgi:hypothetical protein
VIKTLAKAYSNSEDVFIDGALPGDDNTMEAIITRPPNRARGLTVSKLLRTKKEQLINNIDTTPNEQR